MARILRDAGCEVIYAGLRQSTDTITATTIEEDVDVVGVSMHNGAHLTLAPAVVDSLRAAGLDTPVIVGGIAISLTGYAWIDPALSLLIAALILWSSFGIVRETLNILLEGTPAAFDAAEAAPVPTELVAVTVKV